ncbi:MAG TPA: helix-turn-helix domain-containing protein [Candidatus Thermoplasmatota archaeon]|nr:helix-turn-helix domain-containing protein [Candidatus Thermoplasmatota archaeon]
MQRSVLAASVFLALLAALPGIASAAGADLKWHEADAAAKAAAGPFVARPPGLAAAVAASNEPFAGANGVGASRAQWPVAHEVVQVDVRSVLAPLPDEAAPLLDQDLSALRELPLVDVQSPPTLRHLARLLVDDAHAPVASALPSFDESAGSDARDLDAAVAADGERTEHGSVQARPHGHALARAPEASANAFPSTVADFRGDTISLLTGAGALLLAAVAVYSRLRREAVAQQEMRARVLELVGETPAARASPIARALGVHPTTVAYHLRTLERHGFVVAKATPRGRVYFAAGAADSATTMDQAQAAALGDSTVEFARFVGDRRGITQVQAARELGLAPSTVCERVGTLRRIGWIESSAEGGLRATPRGLLALARILTPAAPAARAPSRRESLPDIRP